MLGTWADQAGREGWPDGSRPLCAACLLLTLPHATSSLPALQVINCGDATARQYILQVLRHWAQVCPARPPPAVPACDPGAC